MPPIAQGNKVLVTGANGFIAVWVVKALLDAGYSVRGTVRAQRKAEHLYKIFEDVGERFETVVVEDIAKPGAFDDAIVGVQAIAHTASAVSFEADDPNELIVPAVDGTLSILESARESNSQIKRVILLSSLAAMTFAGYEGVVDESQWNMDAVADVKENGRNANQGNKYRASKTLAEKAAWDFAEKHRSSLTWDLVSLCPAFVYGPILHEMSSPENLNETMKEFTEVVFKGASRPGLEKYQAAWIDVRDVGRAHALALEKGEAGGMRFLLSGGHFAWQDFFDTVDALAIPGVSAPIGTPGVLTQFKKTYDTRAAESVLGMKFTDMKTTTKDIVDSLKEHGYPFREIRTNRLLCHGGNVPYC